MNHNDPNDSHDPNDHFDRFIADDLEIFGIEPEFKEKLRWMDEFAGRPSIDTIDMD